MGNSFYARGDFSGAAPWFQKSVALFPGHPGSLVNLANCSFKAGRPGEAEPLYLRALAVKPDSREALLNQGTLLLQSGRRAEAIPCFRRLVELEPENPAFARNLSWILATAPAEDQRNGPEALALALTADRLTHGNDPSMLRALAAARAETGDFQGAQRDGRRALELSAAGHRPTAVTAELERELSLYRRNLPLHVDR
jgi:Flp pilus assembly protein TadD